MSDRALLEDAAKAAGIDWFDEPAAMAGKGLHMKSGPFWNPLENDGDALRLAVKLRLSVCVELDGTWIDRHHSCWPRPACFVDHADEPYAATRRAIVYAAAEIGRQMP